MKFPERVLILMCVLGLWLALIHKPADPSLAIISFFILAAWYLLTGFFLLYPLPFKGMLRRNSYAGVRPIQVILGIVLGMAYAYCTLGLLFHSLHWMGNAALAENGGIALALTAVPAIILFRRSGRPFYKRLLLRTGIMALLIAVSLGVHPFIPVIPGLARLNPL